MPVAENLHRVEDRIESARLRGGRSDPVTLVAVTKGRGVAAVRELLAAGAADLGENRVQEARAKWPELASDFARAGATRHLIGHLQRNKAAAALELFDVVQSVDSIRLARKISQLASGRPDPVPVLVQVNGGSEPQKHGFSPDQVEDGLAEIAALPGLEVLGLMVLAPLESSEAELRRIFGGMRARFEALRRAHPGLPLRHLSMGMSGDFELAVEEGATMIRVGSALFDGG